MSYFELLSNCYFLFWLLFFSLHFSFRKLIERMMCLSPDKYAFSVKLSFFSLFFILLRMFYLSLCRFFNGWCKVTTFSCDYQIMGRAKGRFWANGVENGEKWGEKAAKLRNFGLKMVRSCEADFVVKKQKVVVSCKLTHSFILFNS